MLLGLAGCGPSREAGRAVPPAAPDSALPTAASVDPDFCVQLERIADAHRQAFVPLRRAPLGDDRWEAAALDADASACIVEGSARASAAHVCVVDDGRGADPGHRAALFERYAQRIDQCLIERPAGTRQWRAGEAMSFAEGERQRLWRDQAAWPRPAIQLKLEEDYARPGQWAVRLMTYTMR